MTEEELIKAKLALAEAIIEEAAFCDIFIDLENNEIDNQLGAVWVGDVLIKATLLGEGDEEIGFFE